MGNGAKVLMRHQSISNPSDWPHPQSPAVKARDAAAAMCMVTQCKSKMASPARRLPASPASAKRARESSSGTNAYTGLLNGCDRLRSPSPLRLLDTDSNEAASQTTPREGALV